MKPRGDFGMVRWAIVGLGLAVVWVAYIALFGPTREVGGGLATPVLEGTGSKSPVDYRWPLRDLDDKPVSFAQFQGKTVVLNLWATWCPPCRAEMPSLAELADDPRVKARGVAVVCVSTDEDPATLRRFVAGKNWPMTILRATSIPSAFLTDGIPATFILTPDGRVAASEVGSARWSDPAVIRFLETLAPASK